MAYVCLIYQFKIFYIFVINNLTMPKLTGNIQFTGSLDNLSAYRMRGSDQIILRKKGGATKAKIKMHPNFALTRQNNAEFGGCSRAGTAIRRAISPVIQLAETRIVGQLNALTRVILALDPVNARGERSISFSQHRQLLEGYCLNRQLFFNTVVRNPVGCAIFRETGSANILIPGLVPGVNLYTPPQYHMYRFIMVLGVVPDMVYKSTGYEPAAPVKYHPANIKTDWYPVKEPQGEQSFDLQLDHFTTLAATHTLVLAMGIEFGYPVSNTIISPVKHAGTAAILATG